MSTVRTRFAPSPTGYMHIGGMRTALFNWLWARHTGGKFILRIDDTDQARNVDDALSPILEAFKWLGLDWDEGPEIGGEYGPYFQSERSEFYIAAVEKLLASGHAYHDFDPPELVQQDRETAEQEKRQFLNVRRSLELSDGEKQQYLEEGRPSVIRLLVDRSQKVSVDDHIRGHVEWDCGLIPDPVIMRGDQTPLYNFATVVDDAAMEITHVIRAEEHLTNTAVQVLIYQALGYDVPEFAHIPFVAAPGTKEKLSKRDKKLEKYKKNPQFKKLFDIADAVFPKLNLGSSVTLNPVMVAYYREAGFLPEAIINGLSRLGWSLDDKTENMSREFVIENFSLDRIVKASAGLDPDKLLSYQEYWMEQLSTDEKYDMCLPFLQRAGFVGEEISSEQRAQICRLIEASGDRLKLASDILAFDEFLVADEDLTYDEKAFAKRLVKPERAVEILRDYRSVLADSKDFTAVALESEFKSWMEANNLGFGDIIHSLRVATTGKASGLGMFEALELLGRESSLARIDRAIQKAESEKSE
ncbi:glutamate--tRNA ligase [Thalassoglobus sp. JC818]|uniref:glutamate--tRNA ligase n=1 Tax=Thalassoglobus sp. JC818 TaxID=3232136 RepID=UPI00345B355C